ncbi:putative mycofactocin system creatinine amidohydrolase family protein MftE [Frondihabitans sucicola]|uniref:Mycofactocin system creatinine amidohydrolase family protein MftE n=1 Tax=Frondihabitans sucicola TaxID=1268041 RepID=A0ABM8GUI6_9MICO|nr:mycofactocin biosynthesis peptidyl-dipeptidase MftE [Frondihabitans sucicola]BDZ52132.1 putative mycofactocin system creatinine amidohydrolase family protein MftE [Frondihabitans sucicola]
MAAPLTGWTELASATWPEVPESPLVLVPTGSTEQHGPHLPFHTDSVVARAVATGVAETLPGQVVVAPTIAFGASGEHADFPGTISIGHDALHALLVETVRSLDLWAGRVVFVNGHGGNVVTVRRVVAEMRAEGHDVDWAPCVLPGGDAHAGLTETSLMLHLRPGDVRIDLAEPGESAPLEEILPLMTRSGVRAVSPNGILGDPTGASAAQGREFLATMVDGVVRRLATTAPPPVTTIP